MRVWLVDDKRGDAGGGLESLLHRLEALPGTDLRVVGVSTYQPDFPAAMRKLMPELLDLLVINERVWPEHAWSPELLGLGMGIILVVPSDRVERARPLADQFPVLFVPPCDDMEVLWLALVSAHAGQRRQAEGKAQLDRLQQRLTDRIVIERAKGVLVHRLGISEDEAYKRLRLLSRRQRRQIRDIAQSLLDAEGLLMPEVNGHDRPSVHEVIKSSGNAIGDRGLLSPDLGGEPAKATGG
jgi:response regulator NasT